MPYPKGIASDRERKRVRTLQLYATFSCLSFAIGLVGLVFFTTTSRGSGQTSLVFTGSPKEHADYVWTWETAQGHHPGWASNNSVRQLIVSVPETRDRAAYWTPRSQSLSYPPRPVSGGILDVGRVQKSCNFMARKYVRDCLEVLRVGAGLDTQRRSRYGNANAWSYIAIRNHTSNTSPVLKETTCAEDQEHILHMFWVGPITDKVYLTLLSFLFTQDVQLHSPLSETNTCSPQIWIWIHPSSDTAMSGRTSYQMKQQLLSKQILSNPWSAPFTHPRLTGIIKFKLWDTEEQVHAIPELRHGWSTLKHSNPQDGRVTVMGPSIMDSSHAEEYDHASVVLSDLARFVLCHRFGGIYVDADFVFLRDWGELLRAPWAFAYSWSRLRPVYNTAVLRLRRGSALGAFILTAALANGMDLHPMAITKYLTNANLEPLLAQLPDALFDPAWLNVDYLQLDRPPQPFFTDFSDFFDTPPEVSAATQALGFDGFFRGSYGYHTHNFWWRPLDPLRNWPDIGNAFNRTHYLRNTTRRVEEGFADLTWSAVLKRTFESYIRGERPNMYGEWLQL